MILDMLVDYWILIIIGRDAQVFIFSIGLQIKLNKLILKSTVLFHLILCLIKKSYSRQAFTLWR